MVIPTWQYRWQKKRPGPGYTAGSRCPGRPRGQRSWHCPHWTGRWTSTETAGPERAGCCATVSLYPPHQPPAVWALIRPPSDTAARSHPSRAGGTHRTSSFHSMRRVIISGHPASCAGSSGTAPARGSSLSVDETSISGTVSLLGRAEEQAQKSSALGI